MPKLKPDTHRARREHILDAAQICFARSGFHRTTMQDICKEAVVSPGALYVYFGSKEDLIAGIVERDRAKLAGELAALAEAPDLLAALSKLGEHYTVEEPQHKRLLCVEIGLEFDPQRGGWRTVPLRRQILPRQLHQVVRSSQARRPYCPGARSRHHRHGVVRHRRRHVLAARRRPEFRRQSRHACAHRHPVQFVESGLHAGRDDAFQSQRDRPMKAKSIIVTVGFLAAAGAGAFVLSGHLPTGDNAAASQDASKTEGPAPLAVSVARAQRSDFTETALVTGSLVPREEIMVAPEVEGLRVTGVAESKKGPAFPRATCSPRSHRHPRRPDRTERCLAGASRRHPWPRPGASIAQAEAKPEGGKGFVRARQAAQQSRPSGRSDARDPRGRPPAPRRRKLVAARDGLQGRRSRQGRRSKPSAASSTGGAAAPRSAAPADGIVSRRMARVGGYRRGRRRTDVPHRRQGRGRARRRGDRDAHRRRAASASRRASRSPASARSPAPCASSRPRSTRAPGSAASASSWATTPACGSAPSRAASIETASSTRPRRPRLRHPLRAATGRPCRWCATQPRRDARGSRPDWLGRRAQAEVREGLMRGRSRGGARRHLPARRRRRAPVPRRPRQAERRAQDGGDSDELEHLRLVDPAAGAVAGAVHGADRRSAAFSFGQLPVTRFPNIDVPIVQVRVYQSGAAPSELEVQVTKKIEDAIAGVNGVKHQTSAVTEGSSRHDHRVPPGGQPGPRPQRRQGRHRPHPRRAAAHHRRADRHAHRDRGPADRHLRAPARRA